MDLIKIYLILQNLLLIVTCLPLKKGCISPSNRLKPFLKIEDDNLSESRSVDDRRKINTEEDESAPESNSGEKDINSTEKRELEHFWKLLGEDEDDSSDKEDQWKLFDEEDANSPGRRNEEDKKEIFSEEDRRDFDYDFLSRAQDEGSSPQRRDVEEYGESFAQEDARSFEKKHYWETEEDSSERRGAKENEGVDQHWDVSSTDQKDADQLQLPTQEERRLLLWKSQEDESSDDHEWPVPSEDDTVEEGANKQLRWFTKDDSYPWPTFYPTIYERPIRFNPSKNTRLSLHVPHYNSLIVEPRRTLSNPKMNCSKEIRSIIAAILKAVSKLTIVEVGGKTEELTKAPLEDESVENPRRELIDVIGDSFESVEESGNARRELEGSLENDSTDEDWLRRSLVKNKSHSYDQKLTKPKKPCGQGKKFYKNLMYYSEPHPASHLFDGWYCEHYPPYPSPPYSPYLELLDYKLPPPYIYFPHPEHQFNGSFCKEYYPSYEIKLL